MNFPSRTFHHFFPPAIRIYLFFFLIFCLAFVAGYGGTLDHSFQLDDEAAIIHNPSLQIHSLSWTNLSALLSGNRPIPNLSFAINFYFGGLNPWGYHLTNILIHILNAFLVYSIFLKTLSLPGIEIRFSSNSIVSRNQIALLGALFWSLHPVQTEAVTYVVQRATSLGTLFYLVSLVSYINGRIGSNKRAVIWFTMSVLSAGMAFGTKENTVTLPAIILLYEYFFISRFNFHLTRQNLFILFGLSFILLIGTSWIVKIQTGYFLDFKSLLLKRYGGEEIDSILRIITEWRVIIYYVSLLLLPLPGRLNLDYDFPLSRSLFNPITTFLSLFTILALLGFALLKARKFPLAAFSIFWFFINLAIESTLLNLDLVFEHRLYLSSLMLFLLLPVYLYNLFSRFPNYESRALLGTGLMISILLISGTYERNKVWETPVSLWSDVVLKSPSKERVLINLGDAYLEANRFAEAKSTFENTIRLYPNDPSALNALGYLYHTEGKIKEAKEKFTQLIEINFNNPAAHLNLGIILAEQGELKAALQEYREAIRLRPDMIAAHLNAGILYTNSNQIDQALAEYDKVLQLNPEFPRVHTNLGQIYLKRGKLTEAVSEFYLGTKTDPKEFEPHFSLGYAFDLQGKKREAIEQYEEALNWAHPGDRAEVETIYKRMSVLNNLKK